MRIVHLSTSDLAGGAARAAWRLHNGLLGLGHESRMVVARRESFDDRVSTPRAAFDLPSRAGRVCRRWQLRRDVSKYRPRADVDMFSDDRTDVGDAPVRAIRDAGGADVITLHWVAGFLDYRSFFEGYPGHVPLVWRLADMNVLTGGCHYDAGCGRFVDRCGVCPQLTVRRDDDLSRQIWDRKRSALQHVGPGGLHLVGTSNWIAGEARRSSLFGRFPVTVIPNGLNTDDFAPRDRAAARDTLGLPRDAKVVLFAADSVDNVRKGFRYVSEALAGVQVEGEPLTLLSVGVGRPKVADRVRQLHLGVIRNDRLLSLAYSAADVYVIASLQESFGQTVIEALACGTPVAAFASGGIVDMVRPGVTGELAPTGDAVALRACVLRVLTADENRRREMSANCRRVAVSEYALPVQARAYTRLYEAVVAKAAATIATGRAVE